MRVPLKDDPKLYEDYFCNQLGNGIPVFVGSYRGRGLGSILGGIGRAIFPLLKSGGKKLLREGVKTGASVVGDLLDGKNFKSSVRARGQQAGKRLISQLVAPPGAPARKRIKRAPSKKRRHKNKFTSKRKADIFS